MVNVNDTLETNGDSFVHLALRHGLLKQAHVDKILTHAASQSVEPSDAALALSLMEPYEVDAVNLLRQPTQLAPGFRLTRLLGSGANGLVFRALQTALDREVALKTINLRSHSALSHGDSRIQREAHAIARLHHPNIVAAYDSGFHNGRFFIAMELVEGETLEDLIRRESPIAEATAWQIARQVAAALAQANEMGIIHRDIKPANLLLTRAVAGLELPANVPFVKVADFGLAFQSQLDEANQLTQAGATLGTPAYVAPEQLQDTHVDARADIYGLGATVYHMLVGRAPLSDDSPMQAIVKKTIGDDQWRNAWPASISPESTRLFRRMTEANAEDRIGNYAELMQEIDLVVGTLGQPAKPPEGGVNANKQTTRVGSRWLKGFFPKLWVGLASLSLLALAAWAASHFLAGANTSPDDEFEWVVSGFRQPLFNGQSVPVFKQAGAWTQVEAADGSRVLQGAAGSWMTVPLFRPSLKSTNVQLRISTHLLPGGSVAFEFEDLKKRSLGQLHISQTAIKFLTGELLEESSANKHVPIAATEPDQVVFQRIQISRKNSKLIIEANGQLVKVIDSEPTSLNAITLHCIDQDAQFADIDIIELVPAAKADDVATR